MLPGVPTRSRRRHPTARGRDSSPPAPDAGQTIRSARGTPPAAAPLAPIDQSGTAPVRTALELLRSRAPRPPTPAGCAGHLDTGPARRHRWRLPSGRPACRPDPAPMPPRARRAPVAAPAGAARPATQFPPARWPSRGLENGMPCRSLIVEAPLPIPQGLVRGSRFRPASRLPCSARLCHRRQPGWLPRATSPMRRGHRRPRAR